MSATSSPSASKVLASSGRRLLRRKRSRAVSDTVIPGWSEGPDPESRDSGSDAAHRPGMTTKHSGVYHETYLLPPLALCPQGAHPRDRAWVDRQDRVRPRHRRAWNGQRRISKDHAAEERSGAENQ